MKLDQSKIKYQREYISGMKFSREAIRKFKYTVTIDGNQFFKDTFYSEVLTKKVKGGEWGKGDVSYYFNNDTKMHDTILELLKSKYELL